MISKRRRSSCAATRSISTIRPTLLQFVTLCHVASSRKTMLTWVNGIAHTMDHMEEGKAFISDLFGGKPVVYCYNPTAMSHDDDMLGYINDLTQAGTQKLGYITSEVDSLVNHLRQAIAKVGCRGRVIHIAHSQGALITALAAKKLTPTEMKQIEVLSFGGAAAITKSSFTPFQRCINYYSVNDPLLLVVPQAAQALRSGFAASHDEFCFLAPRVGDPIADHNLFGPTYAQALEWEGARFQRLYESSLVRTARRLLLLSALLLEVVSLQVTEFFKTLLRPVVIWCVLIYLSTRNLFMRIHQMLLALVVQNWIIKHNQSSDPSFHADGSVKGPLSLLNKRLARPKSGVQR